MAHDKLLKDMENLGLGGPSSDEVLKYLETDEGQAAIRAKLGGPSPEMVALTQAAIGDNAIAIGTRMKVGDRTYVVREHIDEMPGHYTIVPDLSEETGKAPTAAVRTLFHRPTAEWFKRIKKDPAVMISNLYEAIRKVIEEPDGSSDPIDFTVAVETELTIPKTDGSDEGAG